MRSDDPQPQRTSLRVATARHDARTDAVVHLRLDPANGATAQRDGPGETSLVQPHVDRAPRQARAGQYLWQPQKAYLPLLFLFDHARHRSVFLLSMVNPGIIRALVP